MANEHGGDEASVPVTDARSGGGPVVGISTPERKTAEQRKAILAQNVASVAAQGYRVESQSDFQAVIVKGKRINHALHIIVSLLTLVWLIGYLIILTTGGEKRELLQVDDWGNVTRQNL